MPRPRPSWKRSDIEYARAEVMYIIWSHHHCLCVWVCEKAFDWWNIQTKNPRMRKSLPMLVSLFVGRLKRTTTKYEQSKRTLGKKLFFPFCIPYFYADASSNSVCIEIRKTPVSPVVGFHLTIFTRFDFSILRQIDEWQVKGGRR